MYKNVILNGNCLDMLKTLPDASVNSCITSPPYYGLRDYGTGQWIGGDPNCQHEAAKMSNRFERTMTDASYKQTTNSGSDIRLCKKVCPDCGAIREDLQVGLDETPEEYIDRLVVIFREVRRVLKDDGTLWLNIGDSYVGSGTRGTDYEDFNHSQKWMQTASKGTMHAKNIPKFNTQGVYKNKDLIGIPWMLAFALRNDGWYLRQDIIWSKPNPMPESVKDRCTKSHEYIFLLSKSPKYYFDNEAIQENAISDPKRYDYPIMNGDGEQNGVIRPNSSPNSGGMKNWTGKRNKRDVWHITVSGYKFAHFATFPEKLVYPMILASCPKDGIVLDPFMGSGTVAVVAKQNNRNYVGVELNEDYIDIAKNRLAGTLKRLF